MSSEDRRSQKGMLVNSLDKRRVKEADIAFYIYVKPEGRNYHWVKSNAESTPIVVSGPPKTYAPGTEVPLGSNTGTPGQFIITDPPANRKGGPNRRGPRTGVSGSPPHLDGVGEQVVHEKDCSGACLGSPGYGFTVGGPDYDRIAAICGRNLTADAQWSWSLNECPEGEGPDAGSLSLVNNIWTWETNGRWIWTFTIDSAVGGLDCNDSEWPITIYVTTRGGNTLNPELISFAGV